MGPRVRDVMTQEVVTVSPDLGLAELERLFATRRVSGAPVLEGERIVGVVSRADVVTALGQQEAVAEVAVSFYQSPWDEGVSAVEALEKASEAFGEKLRHLRVRDVMNDHVIFVSPDVALEDAARDMAERGVHRLLVLENARLRGILSSLDVVRAVAERGLG